MIKIKTDNFNKKSSNAAEIYFGKAKESFDDVLNDFKNYAQKFSDKLKLSGAIKESENFKRYYGGKITRVNAPIVMGGIKYKGWACIIDQAKENNRIDILEKIVQFFKNFRNNSQLLIDQEYNSPQGNSLLKFLAIWKDANINKLSSEKYLDAELKEMLIDLGTETGTESVAK